MSRVRALAKGASIAGAVSIAVGGTAYAIERIAAGRIRKNTGDGTFDVLEPVALPTYAVASFDGGTINYVDSLQRATSDEATNVATEPTPILLSHGVTLSLRTWVRQLDEFPKRGYRTIAFDHRGHGESMLGEKRFSVDVLADDVRVLLEHLDLHDVVLVGHSMGGIGVQSFLARYPEIAKERVAGIVLLSTLPSALAGSQAARFGQLVERVTRRTPDSTPLWRSQHLGLVLARFGFGKDPVARDVELVRQMMLDCAPETRIGGPRSLIGFNLVEQLNAIDLPTLVIGGTADVITPLRDSQRMHERIVGSRLEVLEGGGHMLMLERADAVNSLICNFAREVAPKRRAK